MKKKIALLLSLMLVMTGMLAECGGRRWHCTG